MIRLWMAEGFIHPSDGGYRNSLEDIGNNYFLSLFSGSFFQDVKRDITLGDIETFKMHDLVHDLALSVVGSHEVATLNTNAIENDVSQARRLRLIMEGIPNKEFDVLNSATKLRTIFFQKTGFVFPSPLNNKCLRVIHGLDGGPKAISFNLKFKHMRYLDLSYSNLEENVHAAEFIHQLYYLQTLNLHKSRNVQKILKEGIGSLINLRHIDISSSDANLLPYSITMLTNLQTLNIKGCKGIRELPRNIGYLDNLPSLDISYTNISALPDSIPLLDHLTKFNFKWCYELKVLPHNFGALTQLRSLDLIDVKDLVELRNLEYWGRADNLRMPSGIEKLTRLEVLEPFIVMRKEDDISIADTCSYNSSSSTIHQLAHLNSLQRLKIVNLENVRGGKIEAERAKLKDKQHIQHLYLEWKYKKEEEVAGKSVDRHRGINELRFRDTDIIQMSLKAIEERS
ncbi:hypothetical protein C5167_013216 [Papaver somniferum]|uniref:NB-ARC domain-containing protein n=1 Tax=Papaver somniferum TaxID=3469 RepID=A0A4Y7IZP7_PAPSO|nr:hypothetical protein C5167_013216 [Papaver somniferum]